MPSSCTWAECASLLAELQRIAPSVVLVGLKVLTLLRRGHLARHVFGPVLAWRVVIGQRSHGALAVGRSDMEA